MLTAVLIDTVSIQKYIFASNRLKENLGASFLVETIYQGYLKESLQETTNTVVDINAWKNRPEEFKIVDDKNLPCEVGYTGGGNTLLFFREKKVAIEFIKNWSKKILLQAPGLQTAVAIAEFEPAELKFKQELKSLHEVLYKNNNKYFPNTVLPKHGLTADCSLSGCSAEVYYPEKNEEKYISACSYAKLKAADKPAQEAIKKIFQKTLAGKYGFTTEIDDLGQQRGENYIAIVHIDGNGMGKRFEDCSSLAEVRKLSNNVSEATVESFDLLLQHVIENMGFMTASESGFRIKETGNKFILPVRPIVLAGDDITFVCDGRLGVHLAEEFIKNWVKQLNQKVVKGKPFSAAAGVAVMKAKYPFFRGYKLSEELCASAKRAEREKDDNKSRLDFYITSGGFSGTLEQIRAKHFKVVAGILNFGPYILDGADIKEEKSIYCLKEGIKYLSDKEKWPRNKVQELRSVLSLGGEAVRQFIAELSVRELSLPKMTGAYSENGWANSETPYFDMVELLEFYPQFLMEDKQGGASQ